MALTFQDEKSLQDALNFWQSIQPDPKVVKKGGLYSIVNLPALSPELITNGNFADGSTGWTLGDGWSVSGGKAHCDGSQLASSDMTQPVIETGKLYYIECLVSSVASNWVRNGVGGVAITLWYMEKGFYKSIVQELGSSGLFYNTAQNGFIGSIKYVSCREILQ